MINATFDGTSEIGVNYLYGNGSFGDVFNETNGNPTTGINRTCAQLACFKGEISTYSCDGSGDSPVCIRTIVETCSPNGCQDDVCVSAGTWSNDQLDSSCQVVYEPKCEDDGNFCFDSACNASAPVIPESGRCVITGPSSLGDCNDGNPCTDDSCVNATGCLNAWKNDTSGNMNDTCSLYECKDGEFPRQDVGAANCPDTSGDLCFFRYCDTSVGDCAFVNTSEIAYGTQVTVTDSAGNTVTLFGCKPPANVLPCESYTCNPDFTCTFNDSTCNCKQAADCFDGDGCTVDICNTTANACQRTTIDCYNELSDGGCPTDSSVTAGDALGFSFFKGTVNLTDANSNPDALGNPRANVRRTCEELACFNNQPSQYRCLSGGENVHTCQRSNSTCTSASCVDRWCQNGVWGTDPVDDTRQISSSCKSTSVTCVPNNLCLTAFCNTSYVSTDPVSLRCIQAATQADLFCNDGDFCTQDLCDVTDTGGCERRPGRNRKIDCSFCRNVPYNDTYVREVLCPDLVTCKTPRCKNNRCFYPSVVCANPSGCFNFICNSTTNNKCIKVLLPGAFIDICNVCNGNGLSCSKQNEGNPSKKSTILAVVLGTVLTGLFCICAAIFGLKKGYDKYQELANEGTGAVKPNPTNKDKLENRNQITSSCIEDNDSN